MRPADKTRAVKEARAARVDLGVGLDAPLPDIVELLEDVADIPVAVLPLEQNVAGACGKKDGRYFIFINSSDGPARRRFTLAHEYGHARLGHGGVVDLQTDIYGGGARRPPEEIEANYFASEFLAPVQAVRNWVDARDVVAFDLTTVIRLGTYFGISAEAALIRLEEANYVLPNSNDRRRLASDIAADTHHGLRESLGLKTLDDTLSWVHIPPGDNRVPRPVFERAKHAWETGLVNIDRLARTVGSDAEHLERDLVRAGAVPPDSEDDDD